MGKLITPETYFTGYTSINLEEIRRYLRDSDQESFWEEILKAKDEGLSDGEILCSFYAKACYAALTTEKNKNISKVRGIYDNIVGTISSGHGCYDEKTEVYTKNGWKFWNQVTINDIFATLNKESGELEWQSPTRIIDKYHDGDMISFKNKHIDLLVTPDHNMFSCITTSKKGRKKQFDSFKLIKAKDLLNVSHCFLKSLPNCKLSKNNLNPLYQLLGFSIGDGYIAWNKLKFHLKRDRKIKYLKHLCKKLNINLEIGENNDYKIDLINLKKLNVCRKIKEFNSEEIFKQIYDKNKQKKIPDIILTNYYDNFEILNSLFDGMMNSDGCIQEKSSIYDTSSSILAGQFQFLLNLLGIASNISQAECYKQSYRGKGRNDLNRCSIYRKQTKPEFNKSLDEKYKKPQLIKDWRGKIYCVEVPNNTLFVRRNGKPVWCGNSVFEHCQLNFMVRDCSRIYTHELVRHRVGTAFSQTSGRYVRTDEINIVFDPILEPVKGIFLETIDFLEEKYKEMETIFDIDNIKDFSKKKKITSAMRRLIPNGIGNEIGFSVNLRSLRHTIEMRTSEHAEWEIRFIFNQIFNLVKEKYPAIFYDTESKEVDGLDEIVFKNKKI